MARRIAVIGLGGTIAMTEGPSGLRPARSVAETLSAVATPADITTSLHDHMAVASADLSFADLAGLVKEQLIVGGVRPEALVDTGGCTQEDTEYFFSYRRDGGDAGRQVGIAVIPAGAPRGMSAGRAPGRVLVNAHQQTTGPSYDYPG